MRQYVCSADHSSSSAMVLSLYILNEVPMLRNQHFIIVDFDASLYAKEFYFEENQISTCVLC